MADSVRLVAPFHSQSGYSHAARAGLRTLLVAGYDVQAVESDRLVKLRALKDRDDRWDGRTEVSLVLPDPPTPLPHHQWPEVEAALNREVPDDAPTVFLQLPCNLAGWQQYVRGPRVAWTMFEAERLPQHWAPGCRGVDTVWVPSSWCAEVFERSVEGLDIRVVPLAVDGRVYEPHGPRWDEVRRGVDFVFLSVFATTERKQWRLLLTAFTEEFAGERVRLVVRPTRTQEVEELAAWCREAGADVQVDACERSDWDLACLYRTADCFVLPSCEGFGLPLVEAALCGTPSVALAHGGSADVVTPETGYLCPCVLSPVVGHRPELHPYGVGFWCTGVRALQVQLRRAYDDRSGQLQLKGDLALARAQRYLPEELAPTLRSELERACARREALHTAVEELEDDWVRRDRAWFTAVGAWGDSMASVGRALEQLKRPHRARTGLLCYGHDPNVARFAEEQGAFDEVVHVRPQTKERFWSDSRLAIQARAQYSHLWLPELVQRARREGVNVHLNDVVCTHVNQVEDTSLCRWHDAKLPEADRAWACERADDWGEFVLLHPLSTQSAPLREHWPHWLEYVYWLLELTPWTYVLTGTEPLGVGPHERLVDLTGKTETMLQVLALCEVAQGVLTTCNAVSLWAVVQRLPALVVANSVFNNPYDYYKRWVTVAPLTVLLHTDTLAWVQLQTKHWLELRFPEERHRVRQASHLEELERRLWREEAPLHV